VVVVVVVVTQRWDLLLDGAAQVDFELVEKEEQLGMSNSGHLVT
jgi:hypothetical protein